MRRYQRVLFTFVMMVFAVHFCAADAWDIYDDNALQQASQVYAEKIRLVWDEDLLAKLTDSEREAIGNVKLDLPLQGYQGHPFDYHSDPKTRLVTIPIKSVKFFDDLAIAHAWLTRHECSQDAISDYVGMLRYQRSSVPPGTSFPTPQQALGIPQNALNDSFVDDVSGKALKSAIYFLMVHELGHLINQNKPIDKPSWQESQAREMEADGFALNVMRRIAVPPIGIVLFFTGFSRLEPAPGDFKNMQAFEKKISEGSTHPLTSKRLLAISASIRSNANAFSQGQENPAIWSPRIIKAADEIEAVGNTLDDPKIREYQRCRSETINVGDLRNSCRPNYISNEKIAKCLLEASVRK